ncbi:PcfJ domain-containing protein [Erysipelotrichaceae bacterium OttesenSCG-928-M19]|nr:PcfJ domain-containing protein [Erysipelotrichaceae bacterium OttesenSCG-928-M19]
MKKVTKKQQVLDLSVELINQPKAVEFSLKKENEDCLILSYSESPTGLICRIYFRGQEIMRYYDDEFDFKIACGISKTLNGYLYLANRTKWREVKGSRSYSGYGYDVYPKLLCIEDLKEEYYAEYFSYCDISIFTGFRYGDYSEENFDNLLGIMTDKQVEYISKNGTTALLYLYLCTENYFNKNQYTFIVNNNLNVQEAIFYLNSKSTDLELIKKMYECNYNYDDYKIIKKHLTNKQIKEYRQLNKKTAHLYLDYISMLQNNNMAINKGNKMPKQIKSKHDKLVEYLQNLERIEKQKEIEKLDLVFVKPSELFEQVETKNLKVIRLIGLEAFENESEELKHCLKQAYFERAAKGETTILAVRNKKQLDKPFYTIQYEDGEVRQFYGRGNNTISQSEFKNELNMIKNKLERLDNNVLY